MLYSNTDLWNKSTPSFLIVIVKQNNILTILCNRICKIKCIYFFFNMLSNPIIKIMYVLVRM